MIVFTSEVDQSDLTAECWEVQLRGREACEKCEFLNTSECGGPNIVRTGKNSKGREVPL